MTNPKGLCFLIHKTTYISNLFFPEEALSSSQFLSFGLICTVSYRLKTTVLSRNRITPLPESCRCYYFSPVNLRREASERAMYERILLALKINLYCADLTLRCNLGLARESKAQKDQFYLFKERECYIEIHLPNCAVSQ